ncbi:Reticulon-like protein B21 [Nymphaea thermarum]|nr:Reticulon-like protein B21 [Nymphaea thermarum]
MNQASRRRAAVKNIGVSKNGSPESGAAMDGKQGTRNSPSNGSLGKNCNLSSIESKRKLWSESSEGAERSPLHNTRLRSSSHNGRILHKPRELGASRETRAVSRSLSASFRREKVGSEEIDGESEELRSEVEVKVEEKHVDEQIKGGGKEEEEEVEVEEEEGEEEEEEEELKEEEAEAEEEEKRLVVLEVKSSGRRKEVVVEDIKENKIPPSTATIGKFDPPEIPFKFSKPVPCHEPYEGAAATQERMQGLVDVFLWRDISRSAFVFGSGSFLLLSSSYAKDLNFSLISVISYVGLFYLAIVFIHRTILVKGGVNLDEMHTRSALREEDAIWLLRLVLPYLNEILFRVKSIFSGDPATTMKVAVLLFLLARCGSSITVWTLARFGFFGVFTIPKVYASYSVQLTRYGRFWIGRFRDAWNSCSHKKAAAIAIFTVIWNLSSMVARVWAAFLLVVAVRLYQQSQSSEWDEVEPSSASAAAAAAATAAAEDGKEAGKCAAQSQKDRAQRNNRKIFDEGSGKVQQEATAVMPTSKR